MRRWRCELLSCADPAAGIVEHPGRRESETRLCARHLRYARGIGARLLAEVEA